ncbi:MAG: PQQ-dependent sugar dehydrogenase, partial [Salinimicrobium sediminis]|nr:PQQ-dependent sugar dehydrogenase [Salinimicrobium sediminis]
MKWKYEEEIIFLKSIKFSFNGIKQMVVLLFLLSTLLGCDNDDDSTPREPEPEMAMDLLLVAEGMTSPVGLTEAPNDSGWLYVIDQAGMVWIIDENGDLMEEAFLDVSDRMVSLNTNYDERGLLGLAFHPSYDSNGKLYVYYTAPPNAGGPAEGESWNNISRISEFT